MLKHFTSVLPSFSLSAPSISTLGQFCRPSSDFILLSNQKWKRTLCSCKHFSKHASQLCQVCSWPIGPYSERIHFHKLSSLQISWQRWEISLVLLRWQVRSALPLWPQQKSGFSVLGCLFRQALFQWGHLYEMLGLKDFLSGWLKLIPYGSWSLAIRNGRNCLIYVHGIYGKSFHSSHGPKLFIKTKSKASLSQVTQPKLLKAHQFLLPA